MKIQKWVTGSKQIQECVANPGVEKIMAQTCTFLYEYEIPEPKNKFKKSIWVNLYSDGTVGTFYTKKDADYLTHKIETREIVLEWEA